MSARSKEASAALNSAAGRRESETDEREEGGAVGRAGRGGRWRLRFTVVNSSLPAEDDPIRVGISLEVLHEFEEAL